MAAVLLGDLRAGLLAGLGEVPFFVRLGLLRPGLLLLAGLLLFTGLFEASLRAGDF